MPNGPPNFLALFQTRLKIRAVILSGLAILLTGFRFIDLIVGAAIGLYVIKEAIEILREVRNAGAFGSDS